MEGELENRPQTVRSIAPLVHGARGLIGFLGTEVAKIEAQPGFRAAQSPSRRASGGYPKALVGDW